VTAEAGFAAVARVGDLAPGQLVAVKAPDGQPVCLMNVGGTICALHDVCTHQQFALSEGEIEPDGTIECAWHGARFDCRTGAVIAPPAYTDVPRYDVRIEGDTILVGARLS
jgi:nitrite reductase/ring-hydroxylating ferredoxin subunit